MTAAERLNEVLKHARMNVKSLSERLGYARPQGLYDVAAGRTKNISPDLCRKIIMEFPEFSRAWLLTGEGEMFIDNTPEQPKEDRYLLTKDTMRVILNMTDTILRQEENITKLTDIVNRLTGGQTIPQKEIAG